jgi:hypothetical protein
MRELEYGEVGEESKVECKANCYSINTTTGRGERSIKRVSVCQ